MVRIVIKRINAHLTDNFLFFIISVFFFHSFGFAQTTTWSGQVWSNGIPSISKAAILNGDYSTSKNGALKCLKLTLRTGKSLTISDSLTVVDSLVNNGTINITGFVKLQFVTSKFKGNKIKQQIVFPSIRTIKIGDIGLKLSILTTSIASVQFQSTNSLIAKMIGDILTPISEGEVMITATQTGNSVFESSTASQKAKVLVANAFQNELFITPWFENKESATVLTYDDWSPGQAFTASSEHIKRGMKGTFFVTNGNAWRADDYTKMMSLVNAGCEIANHTNNHPSLIASSSASLESEINGAKTTIDNLVTNSTVRTFAYPYGDYNLTVINKVKEQHYAARAITPAVAWPYNFITNDTSYYTIPTTAVNPALGISGFNSTIKSGINQGGLVVFMIHSINSATTNDTWYDVISDALHRQMLDSLQSYGNRTWITNFWNSIQYYKERNNATLSIKSDNISQLVLNLTDTLTKNTIFNHPLTIQYYYPAGINYTKVSQSGKSLSFIQANGILSFNAVPDNGEIIIEKSVVTVLDENETLDKTISVYPNPTSDGKVMVRWTTNTTNTNRIELILYNMVGRELTTHYLTEQEAMVKLPETGVYLLKVVSDNNSKVYKVWSK